MVNPHRGEVAFEADGKAYTLRFSVDALCALEEAAGKGIVALSVDLSDPKHMTMGLMRQVIWAGLREHHPDIDVKTAGELIVAAGGLAKIMEHFNVAMALAFPPEKKAERPRKGQGQPNGAGTGPHSAGTGVQPAATTKPSGARPRASSR